MRYYSLFDDAMISMRYAWHLANGHGLVWNPGEYVEGYSNFLVTLIMTAIHLISSLRLAPLLFQLFNLFIALLTARTMLKLMEDLGGEKMSSNAQQLAWAQDIALFFLLSYFPFAFWTGGGMETTLLTLLLLMAVRNLLVPVNVAYPWARDVSLGLMLASAYLTRPDSLVFIFPLLIGLVWLSWNQWPRRQPFLVGGILLAAILGQLLFRKTYYGEWLPNTYYLKVSGLTFWVALKNGFLFLIPFYVQTGFLMLLLVASAAFGPFPLISIFSLFLVFLGTLYHLWVGGDAFLGLWRLMVPTLPFVFLSVGFFLARLFSESLPITKKQRSIAVVAFVAMLSLWHNKDFYPWMTLKDTPGRKLNLHFIETAIALNDVLMPGASVGVFSAGALPYYLPHIRAVDFLGKCDKHVARTAPHLMHEKGLITLPGHNKYDLSYSVLKLRPTFIEHAKWYDDDISRAANALYRGVTYRGKGMALLKDSPYVHWERFR